MEDVFIEASSPCGQSFSGTTAADGSIVWDRCCVGTWSITESVPSRLCVDCAAEPYCRGVFCCHCFGDLLPIEAWAILQLLSSSMPTPTESMIPENPRHRATPSATATSTVRPGVGSPTQVVSTNGPGSHVVPTKWISPFLATVMPPGRRRSMCS